jgi:hypothetical protein
MNTNIITAIPTALQDTLYLQAQLVPIDAIRQGYQYEAQRPSTWRAYSSAVPAVDTVWGLEAPLGEHGLVVAKDCQPFRLRYRLSLYTYPTVPTT